MEQVPSSKVKKGKTAIGSINVYVNLAQNLGCKLNFAQTMAEWHFILKVQKMFEESEF